MTNRIAKIGSIALVLVMMLAVALAAGCTEEEETPTPTAEVGHITLYTTLPPMAQIIESAFEKERGDVLTVVSGPWGRKLKAEMEAGDIMADVTCGASAMLYMMLKDKGELMRYVSPEMKAMKPKYKQMSEEVGEGYFTFSGGRYFVVVYNKEKVEPADAPSTKEDLLDPKWKGKVAIPDATLCNQAFALACSIVQPNLDWSYHEKLRENEPMLVVMAIMVAERVASGEALVGLMPHDGALNMIMKAEEEGVESPLKIVWPEDGAVNSPPPVAIIRDDERSEASTKLAQELVDFILSAEAQTMATEFGFISVREGIPLPEGVPEEIEEVTVDWKWAHEHAKEIRDGFRSIMYGD